MLRSMYSGVLGLQAHQVRMDVIGNNIANVNTVGYKSSRATFQDTFAQTLQGASAPAAGRGGTNPVQVGLGVGLGSIDVDMSQGILQMTGRPTDFAIQGNGFFIVSDGQQRLYTRYGAFTRDAEGYLVNAATGMRLQGWVPDADGNFGERTLSTLTDLRIPLGEPGRAVPTTFLRLGGTLDADAVNPTDPTQPAAVTVPAMVVDSLGFKHTIYIQFTKQGSLQWDVEVFFDGPPGTGTPIAGPDMLVFNPDGTLDTNQLASLNVQFDPGNGAQLLDITLHFDGLVLAALGQPGRDDSTVQVTAWDGLTAGSLESFTVAPDGTIWGQYSNGSQKPLGQIALATFANPDGLLRVGQSAYTTSANSGPEQVGPPASGGRGTVAASTLEASNVDLAAEFTNMIITQRGFQANSRIITASDEMLHDLVNMKR
ncbi:MAG: flagellar hook protein FlgE [Firmicutes bacterium]|nr:flagellar hook protein FlgE [Bacillota bacterium]